MSAGNVVAQEDPVADVKREIARLRAEIVELRAEVQTLRDEKSGGVPVLRYAHASSESVRADALEPLERADGAARASMQPPEANALQPSVDQLQSQIAELSQVKVESTSKMPVKLFGTIHSDAFFNSGNPNWLDNPNLVGAAPVDGYSGSFSATLRQTRLGFTIDGPTVSSFRTAGVVAFDFFGGIPGFATGQVMGLPRLLVGYARLQNDRTAIEVGQDHMILAPVDPTSLAAYAFPALFRSGNLYLRAPQARVEQALPFGLRITGGIVAPIGGDLTGTDYLFVPPALGGERSRRPAFQGRLSFAAGEPDALRRADIGVSGHYAWERRGADLAESSAAAFDFTVRRDYVGAAGEWFVGDNLDAFGGALGQDAPARGGWAEVQLFPVRRLTVAAGTGLDGVRGDRRTTLARSQNRSAYGVALFSITPEIQSSFEYHWMETQVGSGGDRRNHHFDLVMAYKF
jgi:hypothetical protein